MFSKTVAFGLLAAGCMAAAGGGAYVAMRQAAAPAQEHAGAAAPGPVGETPRAPAGSAVEPAPVLQPSLPSPETEPEAPVIVPRAPATRQAARPAAPTRVAQTTRSARPAATPPTPVEAVAAEPIAEYEPVWTSDPLGPPAETPAATATAVRVETIVVPSETVLGVQVETTVSSETARVEDRVEGRVTRDVLVDGRLAIPAGARLVGAVSQVERGGKFRERARIAVSFHAVQLRDGSRVPLRTTAILREGDAPSRETAAKVGGSAVGGAVLGAILGGAKGAVIGGSAGAAGGAAIVAAGDRNPAILPAGTTVSVRLMESVSLDVER